MEQDKLNAFSSHTSKLLRKNFGRGPQLCQSTFYKNHLVTYIRGFISPMEEVLMKQGQSKHLEKARSVVINHLLEELKGAVEIYLEREVEEYYHDWNFPNNSGMMMFVLSTVESNERQELKGEWSEFEKEIAHISQLVQKVPNQINVYPLSPTLCLVERTGVLIPIEKALISKGFSDELKITKDDLEKKYFHRYGNFDKILKRDIKDIFIDWNFDLDKSLMVFVTNG